MPVRIFCQAMKDIREIKKISDLFLSTFFCVISTAKISKLKFDDTINISLTELSRESWPWSQIQTKLRSVCTHERGQDSSIQTRLIRSLLSDQTRKGKYA